MRDRLQIASEEEQKTLKVMRVLGKEFSRNHRHIVVAKEFGHKVIDILSELSGDREESIDLRGLSPLPTTTNGLTRASEK